MLSGSSSMIYHQGWVQRLDTMPKVRMPLMGLSLRPTDDCTSDLPYTMDASMYPAALGLVGIGDTSAALAMLTRTIAAPTCEEASFESILTSSDERICLAARCM